MIYKAPKSQKESGCILLLLLSSFSEYSLANSRDNVFTLYAQRNVMTSLCHQQIAYCLWRHQLQCFQWKLRIL